MMDELFDIKPTQEVLPAEKLAIIQHWAKENLKLSREITGLGHKLNLHIRRPPKFQQLLDMIREESEKRMMPEPSTEIGEGGNEQHQEGMRLSDADTRILVLCNHQGRSEEMAYLIYSYFSAGRTGSSILDLQSLLFFLSTEERNAERSKGLKSTSQNVFERYLLEQRLVDEILIILESGQGFLQAQVAHPELNKDEYKEIFGTDEDTTMMADLQSVHILTNEQTIYEDLQIIMAQLETRIPQLVAKLVVIPEKVALDVLKMIKVTDFDDQGRLKSNEYVTPGVRVKVLDYGQLSQDHSLLQDYKPHKVIMYDHDNYYIRHFQFSRLLDHEMTVSVLVGESYLEGWLYKNRDRREDEAFVKLTKAVSQLHGFKTRAEDRVKYDSALKELDKGKKELEVTRINADGPAVLVDKREFNSDVPGLLYFNGYKVLPMFLKTGDFILSNDIAIERKAFEDFKGSVKGGRLDSQLNQMKAAFTRIYVMIEIHDNHSLQEMNNWLSNRRIAESIGVYRNTRMVSRYNLNLAGLVQLYRERHPGVTFLFSYKPQDTLAYFKYLKRLAGDLNIDKFGEYSKGFEAKSKKVEEYFAVAGDTQDKGGLKPQTSTQREDSDGA